MNYRSPDPNFTLIPIEQISIKINTTLPDTLVLSHHHSAFHEPQGNVAPRHPGCSNFIKQFFFRFFFSIQDLFAYGNGTSYPSSHLPTALNGATFSVEVTVTATEAVMDWHQNPALPHHILQRYQSNSKIISQPYPATISV